jgi:hypothetical protein
MQPSCETHVLAAVVEFLARHIATQNLPSTCTGAPVATGVVPSQPCQQELRAPQHEILHPYHVITRTAEFGLGPSTKANKQGAQAFALCAAVKPLPSAVCLYALCTLYAQPSSSKWP